MYTDEHSSRNIEMERLAVSDYISIDKMLHTLTAKNITWGVIHCEAFSDVIITDLTVEASEGDIIKSPLNHSDHTVIQKINHGIFPNNNTYKVVSGNDCTKCVIVCTDIGDTYVPLHITSGEHNTLYVFSRKEIYPETDNVVLVYVEVNSILSSATKEETIPGKVKLRKPEQISISPLVDYILEDMSDTIKVLGGTEDSEKRSYLIRKLSNLANDLEKIVL